MRRASIKDHKNLLKVFVILLNYGVIGKEDVAVWADSILVHENESEDAFIELSTSAHAHDTAQILNRNSADADTEMTSRAVLGILYHMLQDEKVILKTVFEVATFISYEKRLTLDEQFLLYRFDDHIELNLTETYERLRLFKTDIMNLLSIYQGFRLDNCDDWPGINAEIKQNLNPRLEAFKKNYLY